MRHRYTKIVLVICVLSLMAQADSMAGQGTVSNASNTLLAVKTLDRRLDPVVVQGNLLEHMHGLEIENFRLFAWSDNRFEVIPFQVDEKDPGGEYIFTGGRLAGTDEDNGRFDHNDELVFMARDMGDRIPKMTWSEKGLRGAEVMVIDPQDTAKKGWVYFIYFLEAPPPLSEKDYVDYAPEEEVIRSKYYHLGYEPGAPLYSDLIIPKEVGGSGEDLFDRIKIRINVKTLFNLLSISKTEEDLNAETVGWKDGPLRVLRNVQTKFRIFFNLSSPSISSVSEYYDHYMYIPLKLTIPFNLKWVFNSFGISDWNWFFYGDLPGMKGGKFYSNRNLQGVNSSGNRSPEEVDRILDESHIIWAFITKEGVGTWFPRLVLPDIIYQNCRLYIVDNENFIDPPEDIPGVIGGGVEIQWRGTNEEVWFLLAKGTYELSVDSYFPSPGMKIEEVDEWLRIRDFPPSVEVTGTSVTAPAQTQQAKDMASFVKKKKDADQGFCGILTDVRNRKFTLDRIYYYIGSSRVTPRTFVLGETMSDEKFHRLEFKEIKRIEHRIDEIDPVTGMKNPMFQKVIKQDGKILDLMSCKPCGFSGRLPTGKKAFFWNTQIHSIDFQTCASPE